MLFAAGCGSDNSSSEAESTSASVTEPATEITEAPKPTETEQTSIVPADSTPDSAEQVDDSKITFNTLEIKRNLDEIKSTLNNYADSYKFRGALYTKVGNDFEHHIEKGAANYGAHIDNSIYRSYYSGSVTKLFTAAAVMKLKEDKGLDLNTTIDKYFPKCAYAKDVTILQLLTMTARIPNYIRRENNNCLVPELEAKVGDEEAPEKLHSIVLEWILSRQRIGDESDFFYSDSNYFLLGDIIAAESKMSYEDYLNEAILKSAYMTKTSFAPDESTARPYTGDHHSAVLLREGIGYSSLGMITNVSDLMRFVDSLMSYQILSADSLAEIFKDYGYGYGYGVYVNGSRVSCIGKIDAYSAKLSFTTDRNQVFVALSNYSGSDPNFIHRLFRNYMVQYRN